MRIMTTNIWGDYFGNPVSVREDNMLKVYENYKPDFIGFQEVTDGWHSSRMFAKLEEEYFFTGNEIDGCFIPLAIKKNFTLLDNGYIFFTDTPDASKAITWAVVKDEQGRICGLCNTHFWWEKGEEHDLIRISNAGKLVDIMKDINERFSCPVFAFGDMNCKISSEVFTRVYTENGVKHLFDLTDDRDDISSHHGNPVSDEDGNYHGQKTSGDSSRSIDHIVSFGDGFKVIRYRIVEDQYALDASDHSPVYADVEPG